MSQQLLLVREALDYRELPFRELSRRRFVTGPSSEHSGLSFHVMVGATTEIVQIAAFLKGAATIDSPQRDAAAVAHDADGKVCSVNGTTVGIYKLVRPRSIEDVADGLDRAALLVLKSYASPNRSSVGAGLERPSNGFHSPTSRA